MRPPLRPRLGTVATAGLGVLALLVAAGGLVALLHLASPTPVAAVGSASPTPPPTPIRGVRAEVSGATIVSDQFVARLPQGWRTTERSGADWRVVQLHDVRKNTATVSVREAYDAAATCRALADAEAAQGRAPTLTGLPDATWGGVPATRVRLAYEQPREVTVLTCARRGGRVFTLTWVAWADDEAAVRATMDAMTSSWTWL